MSVAKSKALRIAFLSVKALGVNNPKLKPPKSASALIDFEVCCTVAVWDFADKYRNRRTDFTVDFYVVGTARSIFIVNKTCSRTSFLS